MPDMSMTHIRIDITCIIIYLGVPTYNICRHNTGTDRDMGIRARFNVKNTTPRPVQFLFFFPVCVKVCCLTTKTVGRYRAAAGKPTERKRTIGEKRYKGSEKQIIF